MALTIAGSDSGGGAGIQADIKTMGALGAFAVTAVTAVTAQNTARVDGVHVLPAEFVHRQIVTVLADLPVAATKTGMLADVEIIAVVGQCARSGELPKLVVDPVMVSSSGQPLLDDGGVVPTGTCWCRSRWWSPPTCGRRPCSATSIRPA